MNIKILNILCEGQTEELFVKTVLKPFLSSLGLVVKKRLLITSKKKNAKGGMISYQQVKGDLNKWIDEVSRKSNETHYFTTMFDWYALPNDFPGYEDASHIQDPYMQVENIEESFFADINNALFIPYIQLHEFEALLFCDISKLSKDYPNSKRKIIELTQVITKYKGNPELINSSEATAPSKRIINALKGKYHYNKPKSGVAVTASIGLDGLRSKCSHFDSWLKKIEQIEPVK